jgi:hypothetical protein
MSKQQSGGRVRSTYEFYRGPSKPAQRALDVCSLFIHGPRHVCGHQLADGLSRDDRNAVLRTPTLEGAPCDLRNSAVIAPEPLARGARDLRRRRRS